MGKIQYYSLIGVIIVACFFALAMDDESKNKSNIAEQNTSSQQSKSAKKEKEFFAGVVLAHSLWVEDIRNLYDYKDGFISDDKEFLLQLVREGKAKFVENPTGVVWSGTYAKGEILKIKFFEGRYKNKSGYIFADFVQKIDTEKDN